MASEWLETDRLPPWTLARFGLTTAFLRAGCTGVGCEALPGDCLQDILKQVYPHETDPVARVIARGPEGVSDGRSPGRRLSVAPRPARIGPERLEAVPDGWA
jgi:hypothetical protein